MGPGRNGEMIYVIHMSDEYVQPIQKTMAGLRSTMLSNIKRVGRYIRSRIYHLGDYIGIIGPERIYDDNYYRKRQDDPWRSDAHSTSEALYLEFEPDSVIDFGCAIGGHLEWFHQRGTEIHGVEGNSKAFDYALVPTSTLEQHDLRERYESETVRDLAICIEVAEHIPSKYSGRLVDSLTDAAETVFFTAAPPGQSGTHHVNLRPEEFWEKKFEKRGFVRDQEAEEGLIRGLDLEKTTWVEENLFVFSEGDIDE